ncbi:reticulon-like protein B21 [Corylus avellana]|uniref:reticulon-like protein B21 n=1 Tax=Corylus avellana TaxID=13451 RepID=UPI00286B5646|nr:reticulon-like protein B21 [Corylus avellana]
MDEGRRRSGVVAGSVWESRMKIDEVKGGIKVFNGEEGEEESSQQSGGASANGGGGSGGGGSAAAKVKRGQTGAVAASGKRKTWKSESFEGFDKSPFQISKRKPEPQKNSEEQLKELSVSADGIKKSPVQSRKLRSDEKFERSPIQTRKPRSAPGIEKNSVQLRKVKSDSVKGVEGSGNGANQTSSVQLRKAKSDLSLTVDESVEEIGEGSVGGSEKIPVDGSDETCKEFGVCQDKVITDRSIVVNCAPKVDVNNGEEDDGLDVVDGEDEGDEEEVDDEETEIEIDVKKIDVPEPKKIVNEEKKIVNEEKKIVSDEKKIVNDEKKIVNEEKKLHHHQVHRKPMATVKQPPPIEKRRAVYQNLSKPTPRHQNLSKPTSSSYEFQTFPETHSKLQSFVDLVMWKEVPRSALVLLIGSFVILSSSYTKDINLSFVSVISYLGLVYLAAIFIYRTLICRGVVIVDDSSYVLGEQEAIWLLRLFLPYVNELLLKLRALFSGDPSTTMKLAVLLFVLARCGSCITIWTVVKLGFVGVFTLPKICSLYSAQLTAIAKFWLRRFQDIWDSCSHKKAVAASTVFLILNLSSTVARIWEVFMLYVAFRCYQQSSMRDDWVEDEAGGDQETS